MYSIRGGRSLYTIHLGLSQFTGHEAYSWRFVTFRLGSLSNRSLYQTFSVKLSFLYQAVGTQASHVRLLWRTWFQRALCERRAWRENGARGARDLLASSRLGTKGAGLLKISGTSFGCLVNRAFLVQISKNMLRVP